MYTIGQVAGMFDISASTLRYYDKEGLFPRIERENGIRRFSDSEIESLRVIQCLKKSGMEIKDIKTYMELCKQGNATLKERKALFVKQKENVEAELEHMKKVLDMINFKCWYYDTAIADGGDERVRNMKPEDMPEEIKEAYMNTH